MKKDNLLGFYALPKEILDLISTFDCEVIPISPLLSNMGYCVYKFETPKVLQECLKALHPHNVNCGELLYISESKIKFCSNQFWIKLKKGISIGIDEFKSNIDAEILENWGKSWYKIVAKIHPQRSLVEDKCYTMLNLPFVEKANYVSFSNTSSYSNGIVPKDFLFPMQWDFIKMNLPQAWQQLSTLPGNITFGSPTIKVAVIDDGIESTPGNNAHPLHPDLNVTLSDGSLKLSEFYDFRNFINDNNASGGHAVSVAGTIGAAANGNGTIGVAPNVKLLGSIYIGNIQDPNQELVFLWPAGLLTEEYFYAKTDEGKLYPGDLVQPADILSNSHTVVCDTQTTFQYHGPMLARQRGH